MDCVLGDAYRLSSKDYVIDYAIYQGKYEHDGETFYKFCHMVPTKFKQACSTFDKTVEIGKPFCEVGWYQTHLDQDKIDKEIVKVSCWNV